MLKIILNYRQKFLVLFITFMVCAHGAAAQSTGFTYQGKLTDTNLPANGTYDFEFKLFTALIGGTQDGTPRQVLGVTVTNGVFSVLIDFGAGAFPGADRFLEIAVRPAGSGSFTTLTPRQQVNITPYAIKSSSADVASFATNAQNAINATTAETAQNATTAQNALQLGGVAANQFVQTSDGRLSDARNPLAGSANYIQNTAAQQATSNFNISGNGTAGGTLAGNIISATTQYNIGLARVIASPGSFNFFAGNGAGQSNTTGSSNSFFGVNAGIFNQEGGNNAFFGFEAGRNNREGSRNSFFGKDAGRSSTTGNDNSFFGTDAGQSNTEGSSNSFFGKSAGEDNTTATGNSFFGALAGSSTTTGGSNAFFGFEAGRLSVGAVNNSFFGFEAGESNIGGINNAYFGFVAGKLATGSRNAFFGSGAGQGTTGGSNNAFFGGGAGSQNTTGGDNTFFGIDAGNVNTTGSSNTIIGADANVADVGLTNATAIGGKAYVSANNSLVLGQINGVNGATASTSVGIGTTAPLDRLHVNGIIRVISLGAAGITSLCRNANEQISTCSSSLRYKTNINSFGSGLSLVNRLQPITFNWKDGGMRDLGLGAEDVAAVEPLLVTHNDKGEVEGVKYDRVAIVLLNAVKEQQQLIQKQQAQIDELKKALRFRQSIETVGNAVHRAKRVSQKPSAQQTKR
jgi:trimeric autotransporter adhesin